METKTYTANLNSPIGWLKLKTSETHLLAISFTQDEGFDDKTIPEIMVEVIQQLKEYFAGTRKLFNLPVAPMGTEFQMDIWNSVAQLGFGETTTYLALAIQSGSKKNTRAVGLANGKNPIPIVIPCHRVIGSNGKLTGYAGGLERKRWLLQHESNHSEHKGRLF